MCWLHWKWNEETKPKHWYSLQPCTIHTRKSRPEQVWSLTWKLSNQALQVRPEIFWPLHSSQLWLVSSPLTLITSVLFIDLVYTANEHILLTLNWCNAYVLKVPVVNNPLLAISKVFRKKAETDIHLRNISASKKGRHKDIATKPKRGCIFSFCACLLLCQKSMFSFVPPSIGLNRKAASDKAHTGLLPSQRKWRWIKDGILSLGTPGVSQAGTGWHSTAKRMWTVCLSLNHTGLFKVYLCSELGNPSKVWSSASC